MSQIFSVIFYMKILRWRFQNYTSLKKKKFENIYILEYILYIEINNIVLHKIVRKIDIKNVTMMF